MRHLKVNHEITEGRQTRYKTVVFTLIILLGIGLSFIYRHKTNLTSATNDLFEKSENEKSPVVLLQEKFDELDSYLLEAPNLDIENMAIVELDKISQINVPNVENWFAKSAALNTMDSQPQYTYGELKELIEYQAEPIQKDFLLGRNLRNKLKGNNQNLDSPTPSSLSMKVYNDIERATGITQQEIDSLFID